MGFLGISLPAEKGGVGGTFLDEAIVLEEQVSYFPYQNSILTTMYFQLVKII